MVKFSRMDEKQIEMVETWIRNIKTILVEGGTPSTSSSSAVSSPPLSVQIDKRLRLAEARFNKLCPNVSAPAIECGESESEYRKRKLYFYESRAEFTNQKNIFIKRQGIDAYTKFRPEKNKDEDNEKFIIRLTKWLKQQNADAAAQLSSESSEKPRVKVPKLSSKKGTEAS